MGEQILKLLEQLGLAEYHTRFIKWTNRNYVYRDVDGYKAYSEWLSSIKLGYQLNKLQQALQALEALEALKDLQVQDEVTQTNNHKVKSVIVRIIHIELIKLELVQFRKLNKIQRIKRKDLQISNDELKNEIKIIKDAGKAIETQLATKHYNFPIDELNTAIATIKKLLRSSNRPDILADEILELTGAVQSLVNEQNNGSDPAILNKALKKLKESIEAIEEQIEGDDVEILMKELRAKRKALRKALEVEDLDAKGDSKDQTNAAQLLLDREKNKIHFTKHINNIGGISDIVNVAQQGTSLVETIANQMPSILSLSDAVGGFFSAIPIVSILLTALTSAVTLVKNLVQNKSNAKTLGLSAVLLVAGGALLALAFAPVLPLIIAISGGFALYGFVRADVLPNIGLLRQISKKAKQIRLLEEEMGDRGLIPSETTLAQTAEREEAPALPTEIKLHPLEKKMLLRKIEQVLVEKGDISGDRTVLAALLQAKALINVNSKVPVSELVANELIAAALGVDSSKTDVEQSRSLMEQLHIENDKTIAHEEEALAELKKAAFKQRIFSILGIVSLIGGGLAFFPPTMILGASILAATTVAGLLIKYDVIPKIARFFKERFGSSQDKKSQAIAETQSNISSNNVIGNVLNSPSKAKRQFSDDSKKVGAQSEWAKDKSKPGPTFIRRRVPVEDESGKTYVDVWMPKPGSRRQS